MKHTRITLVLSALALSLGVFAFVSTKKAQEEGLVTFATYTNGDAATYYSSISDSVTGDALLSSLRSLNSTKRKSTAGYSAMGTTPSGQFKYTDYVTSSAKYDSNGQPYGTQIVSFYSGNATSSFNREHVWPKSHGGDAAENDIHMPRPTIESENGSRGNSFYVEGKCSSSAGWDPAMEDFGDETYRGDSARIIFYTMLVDTRYQLIEADSHSTSNKNKDYMMGRLSHLIKWNINYPVLDREKRRNEGAEYLQGNRNPFIDHPEYACRIWGDTNSDTRSLCSNAVYPSVAHTAGIRTDDGYNISSTNIANYNLAVGATVNFLPFVDGAYNASVSWSLSDYDVASQAYYGRGSYTNGVTITGLANGTSVLTVSYSYSDNGTTKYATATCVINVGTGGSSGGGSAEGVENIQTATYTVASTSSVTKTGTAPTGSSASYSQTYTTTAGQVTSGKNAVLTLSGYSNKVITGITLNMKSNASSGSGSFSAVAGSTNLANESGKFNTWYDNTSFGTSYRDVHVELTNSSYIIGSSETLTLTISGSDNSLYIHSYTISYGDPAEESGEDATLSSISATGMTTSYSVGDTFAFDGILKATYSDGNVETVIPDSVSSPDMSTTGTKTITVTYSDGEVTKTFTYQITVSQSSGDSSAFSGAYNRDNQGTTSGKTWTLTDYSDQTSYLRCPENGSQSVALISGIFTNKTITSNITITINSATFGSGANPSSSTFSIYNSSACTTAITSTQSGTLPTSSTYTNFVYTVSLANASSLTDDLAIKIVKPGKQLRLKSISVSFSYTTSGSSSPTLSSISLNTNNVTTIFTVGDTFNYTGLVVTANYSDSTSETISSGYTVSTPDMSTAGTKEITVTYSGKAATYNIIVNAATPTSIIATVKDSKTFYVGETITKSDITVTTNTGVDVTDSVTFVDYQFKYDDAASGGTLTSKQFIVTYNGLSATLTVGVQRKARSSQLTETCSVTYTDLPTAYNTSTTERTAASGVKYIAYNLANYTSKMQFKRSGGYFQTTQEMSLMTITINNRDGSALTVYGSNTAGSFSTTITGNNDTYDLSSYKYVKIINSNDGAVYCSSIAIVVSVSETAANVANYIMYEDTTNQCTTKLNTAITYLNNLSSSELNTFKTSTDYVIATARERLEAWARNQGKTIDYSDGATHVVLKSGRFLANSVITENSSISLILIITSALTVSAVLGYFLLKRKKQK